MLHRSSFIRGGLVLVGITSTKNKYFYEVFLLNKLGTCSTTVRNQTCGRWKKSLASPSSRRSFSFAALSYLIVVSRSLFLCCNPAFPTFPPQTHQNPQKSLVCGGNFWKKNTAKRLSKKKSAEPLTESNPWKHTVDINQKSSDHQWRSW